MRLRPVAPQQALQALRDTVLGDVQVRQGMVVFCVMRRDSVSEQHVPNASAFDPERWLNDDRVAASANPAKRISMPFGAGPRICPGRYLALLEIKMAMAALLGHFDIDAVATPDGREPKEVLQIAMAPVGLTMRLCAEASSSKS
jgi:cytochrome P450